MAFDVKQMVGEIEAMQKENELLKQSNKELLARIEGMIKIITKIREFCDITMKPMAPTQAK